MTYLGIGGEIMSFETRGEACQGTSWKSFLALKKTYINTCVKNRLSQLSVLHVTHEVVAAILKL